MSFNTGFRGHVGGYVQKEYTDQPGEGVPGMLAFASDINMCDSLYVGQPEGVAAGVGVRFSDIVDPISLQRPNIGVYLPNSPALATDFAGIVVFDEQMQSDANGIPGAAHGRHTRILRDHRVGGRVYIRTPFAVDHTGAGTPPGVYWYFNAISSNPIPTGPIHTYNVGDFGPVADAANNVLIPNLKWTSSSYDFGVAIIESLGRGEI